MLAALVQGQQLQHPLFHPEKGVKKKNSSKIATQWTTSLNKIHLENSRWFMLLLIMWCPYLVGLQYIVSSLMERNSKWQSSSRNGVTMPLGIWGQFREATATSTKFSNKEDNFIHAEIEKLARKGVLEETKHSKNVFFSNFSLRKQKDVSYCLILNCACYSCKLCIIALQVIAQTTYIFPVVLSPILRLFL